MLYELITVVHGKEAQVESVFTDRDELIEQAVDLLEKLRAETDVASWSIAFIVHECDGTQGCDCREKLVESFRGITLPDPWPMPSY